MTDSSRPFEYDHDAFDRQFMSCLYRHAVVWLERLGRPVHLLFYNALASSDMVLSQIVVSRQPKFAFRCNTFSDDDFKLIGVTEVLLEADSFQEIRQLILQRIEAHEFALVEGNVYYLPHCPEYRQQNNQHVVVIHGIENDGRWKIVDDDPSSILRGYSYEEGYIERFFNHSINRKLRCYDIDNELSTEDSAILVEKKFHLFVQSHEDSHEFFDRVDDFLHSPFDSESTKQHLLHDAFAVISGSRQCFSSYLQARNNSSHLVELSNTCAKSAGILKMLTARAKLTGVLNHSDLITRVTQLRKQEVDLAQHLQDEVA